MRVKGVEKSLKQIKGKWKTLLQEFRKIRNHDNRSGEAPYNSMEKAARKEKKLPPRFLDQWRSLLETFQGRRHINNPVCLESSSRAPMDRSSDPVNILMPDVTTILPAESRSGPLPAGAEAKNWSVDYIVIMNLRQSRMGLPSKRVLLGFGLLGVFCLGLWMQVNAASEDPNMTFIKKTIAFHPILIFSKSYCP
ncbi:hypothetical protein R1flu_021113 [Riccia fluitans]|uniref:MADF domain-containing protein n=1 Tax=Riccia fluitans TaxID=41844 RepID=A0ABD1ZPY1_9MARC